MSFEEFSMNMLLLGLERIDRKRECPRSYGKLYKWHVINSGHISVYASDMSERANIYQGFRIKRNSLPVGPVSFHKVLDIVVRYLDEHKPKEKITND